MTTSALSVANELIRLSQESKKPLTPMQLIKMIYIAHGWMLGIYKRPLIHNRIEAWKYNPVIPDLYQSLKRYGSGYITQELSMFFGRLSEMDTEEKDLVRQIHEGYGSMNGIQLSQLTHQPGTPWYVTT